MVLDSLLLGIMLFGSFAIRTPNVQPNPDDYEVSIGLSHPSFYINRQWERELGTKYIDDLVWIKLDNASIYFKPEYMDKQSKSVKYLKLDWRKTWQDFSYGFTTRSTTDKLDKYETFASVGLSKKKKYGDKVDIEVTFDGYMPSNEVGDNTIFEYEDKFKVSYQITKKIKLYNLGEISKLKGKQYYKGKIGIEVAL
jgi:hypothetical protein